MLLPTSSKTQRHALYDRIGTLAFAASLCAAAVLTITAFQTLYDNPTFQRLYQWPPIPFHALVGAATFDIKPVDVMVEPAMVDRNSLLIIGDKEVPVVPIWTGNWEMLNPNDPKTLGSFFLTPIMVVIVSLVPAVSTVTFDWYVRTITGFWFNNLLILCLLVDIAFACYYFLQNEWAKLPATICNSIPLILAWLWSPGHHFTGVLQKTPLIIRKHPEFLLIGIIGQLAVIVAIGLGSWAMTLDAAYLLSGSPCTIANFTIACPSNEPYIYMVLLELTFRWANKVIFAVAMVTLARLVFAWWQLAASPASGTKQLSDNIPSALKYALQEAFGSICLISLARQIAEQLSGRHGASMSEIFVSENAEPVRVSTLLTFVQYAAGHLLWPVYYLVLVHVAFYDMSLLENARKSLKFIKGYRRATAESGQVNIPPWIRRLVELMALRVVVVLFCGFVTMHTGMATRMYLSTAHASVDDKLHWTAQLWEHCVLNISFIKGLLQVASMTIYVLSMQSTAEPACDKEIDEKEE
ncbi:hypothetical protein BGZ73_002477 [Actinomortierella ambigua]|nr:hypothetical protein BGZ73_002477 [Actinomortierella ambigua]